MGANLSSKLCPAQVVTYHMSLRVCYIELNTYDIDIVTVMLLLCCAERTYVYKRQWTGFFYIFAPFQICNCVMSLPILEVLYINHFGSQKLF